MLKRDPRGCFDAPVAEGSASAPAPVLQYTVTPAVVDNGWGEMYSSTLCSFKGAQAQPYLFEFRAASPVLETLPRVVPPRSRFSLELNSLLPAATDGVPAKWTYGPCVAQLQPGGCQDG